MKHLDGIIQNVRSRLRKMLILGGYGESKETSLVRSQPSYGLGSPTFGPESTDIPETLSERRLI